MGSEFSVFPRPQILSHRSARKNEKAPRGSFPSWRTGQFTRLSSLGYHGRKVRPVCRSDVYWGYRASQNHACGIGKSERAVSGSLLFLLPCRRIEGWDLPACLFVSRRIDHRPGGRRKLGPRETRLRACKKSPTRELLLSKSTGSNCKTMGFFFISPNRLTKSSNLILKSSVSKATITRTDRIMDTPKLISKKSYRRGWSNHWTEDHPGNDSRTWKKEKIYQFNLPQIQDVEGRTLRNPVAYYTLNELVKN